MSFDAYLDFAEQIIREERYFEKLHYDHFRPMIHYCVKGGELLVDDILLLENIVNELAPIKELIGSVALPKKNRSADSYQELKTGYDRNQVYAIYSEDKALHDHITSIKRK